MCVCVVGGRQNWDTIKLIKFWVLKKTFKAFEFLDIDWQKLIIEYLGNPTGMTDRKIKYMALSHVIMGNELFKKTPKGILLKCLGESEAYLAISEVHKGSCGSHQIGHKMKWLLFRLRVYWQTMLKYCIDFAKGCQECQRHLGIQHVPASKSHSIVNPWPFRGWVLGIQHVPVDIKVSFETVYIMLSRSYSFNRF